MKVLRNLFNYIQESMDMDVKLSILICISDLLLGLGPKAESEIDNVIKIVDLCFQGVYQLSSKYPIT